MEVTVPALDGRKKVVALSLGAVVLLVVILFGVVLFLRRPGLVSPVPNETDGAVRVVFVTPTTDIISDPSPEASSSASSDKIGASPTSSAKATPKSTPKPSAPSSASKSAEKEE